MSDAGNAPATIASAGAHDWKAGANGWTFSTTLTCGCIVDHGFVARLGDARAVLPMPKSRQWPLPVRCKHGRRKVVSLNWHSPEAST